MKMTNITIPPAALEAGARAAAEDRGYDWDLHPSFHKAFKRMARAAFLAIVENWEGAKTIRDDGRRQTYVLPALILPITEASDDDGQPDEVQEWNDYDPDC